LLAKDGVNRYTREMILKCAAIASDLVECLAGSVLLFHHSGTNLEFHYVALGGNLVSDCKISVERFLRL
jgi:hypothetical protein